MLKTISLNSVFFSNLFVRTSSPRTALFLSSKIECLRSFFIRWFIDEFRWSLSMKIGLETTNSTRITTTTSNWQSKTIKPQGIVNTRVFVVHHHSCANMSTCLFSTIQKENNSYQAELSVFIFRMIFYLTNRSRELRKSSSIRYNQSMYISWP